MSFEQNITCIIAYDNSYWCNINKKLYKLHEIKASEKKVYQKTNKTQEEISRNSHEFAIYTIYFPLNIIIKSIYLIYGKC